MYIEHRYHTTMGTIATCSFFLYFHSLQPFCASPALASQFTFKVVRMIIETGEVSGSAILTAMTGEICEPKVAASLVEGRVMNQNVFGMYVNHLYMFAIYVSWFL